ncbi:hypothetical protein [Actinoplanes aureus]|uniref:Uncharacterized protein n=1 Tax=Actinoplanes aureus TaxID=2792083 RepID=A0A931C9T4_9ACTN|nr:hypothetical protein [Actinoplanes aureus]MBG0566109.1 hypothetical protein [Actinoplanes aureus]
MTITDSRVSGYQTALREIASTADRFAEDGAAARTMAEALQTGDPAGVSRALKRLGVSAVGYAGRAKRPPLDEDPGPTNYEVFRLMPAEDGRFPSDINIEIHISVSC